MQFTAICHCCKNANVPFKIFDFFLIFAQNIDRGYTLEPPESVFRSKNMKNVYPCKSQFYYIKVGCKGVFVTRTCFRNVMSVHNSLVRFGLVAEWSSFGKELLTRLTMCAVCILTI